jgi:hypothetical protein
MLVVRERQRGYEVGIQTQRQVRLGAGNGQSDLGA